MARVLLVENEGVWLDMIREALPEHDVDKAQSYKDALTLLGSNVAYDVAIVDLNLVAGGTNDRLGGNLLKYMRDRHPTIRRIVLTGETPTSARALFDEYNPDDVLLKHQMDLSVVRGVVETALDRAAGDVPDNFGLEKLKLRNSLHSWEESALLRLTQRARRLRNDIQEAERTGKKADDSATTLAALEARMQDLKTECANLAAAVTAIHSVDDHVRAREEFARLKAIYGA